MNNNNSILLFFDFETNGLDPLTCGILHTAIIDSNQNIIFNQYTYPYNNIISGKEIHGIDESVLIQNNAIQSNIFFNNLIDFININYTNKTIYWIAYNNFGYDQFVLESHLKRLKLNIPSNWYFLDLYPFIKEVIPNLKPNYKLKTVYESLFPNDTNLNFHSALTDTKCIHKIYFKINQSSLPILYQKYCRRSVFNNNVLNSPISCLPGYTHKINFSSKNIYTIADLYNKYVFYNFNQELIEKYLKDDIGIYSQFYIKCIYESLLRLKTFYNS